MRMSFPGGVAVEAALGHHRIRTDQPRQSGGADSAPAPFDLFLASIGTCAGFYALRFCQQRGIDTQDLGLGLEVRRSDSGKRVDRIDLQVDLPAEFPEKYRAALIRAIDQCTVKRHILEPPEFGITTSVSVAAQEDKELLKAG